ncbi:MAG: N-acetylglucosamine-6-phosphate deacetylase [Rhodobacteraceae bacterium]|nr:N-acetylglucosamine-6-phosphate deacetylase [Paracoccaceae bacterium]
MATLFEGATVFDGHQLRQGGLLVDGSRFAGILPAGERPDGTDAQPLAGGLLVPGFVDLQVNGGDGVMLNDSPTAATIGRMVRAHERLGTLTMLPTLITDRSEVLRATVDAAVRYLAEGGAGIAGLHLEGPHLSIARKGAHDPALIRPMTEADLVALIAAKARLPHLMVTLAPESATPDQISRLSRAGIVVALGHTDSGYQACRTAMAAGATVATHLFNAMSQIGNREPGLAGAVLRSPSCHAGLIADGIHVDPEVIAVAMQAKAGPGQIFLVTDAMAPAGSDISEFTLNGRTIRRENGRLTLADGTLAGADLDMATALRVMTGRVGLALDRALAMATSVPATVMGIQERAGYIEAGQSADFVHLSDDLVVRSVWRGGNRVFQA